LLLIDAGTSYIKAWDSKTEATNVYPIIDLNKNLNLKPDYITGHNSKLFENTCCVNELVALAEGAKSLAGGKSFTVLDIGARDMKLVTFTDGNFERCDWNTSCGAMVGFTIELIMKYFNKAPQDLKETDAAFDITCGLLGITKFFDSISKSTSIEDGISSLIKGLAKFSWQFAGSPKSLYLSGGLSENPMFVYYLKKLSPDLIPLGRFVLIEGLKRSIKK